MTGTIAFRSEPEVDGIIYTFTVKLLDCARPELVIDLDDFKPGVLTESDNPLIEMIIDSLRAAEVAGVRMHIRLYRIHFQVAGNLASREKLEVVEEAVEALCSIGKRHDPVYAAIPVD